MDLPVGRKQSKEFWKAHVDACASYSGSIAAYCQEHGLSKSQMSYYREKFSGPKKFAEVKAVEGPCAESAASMPNVPVQIQQRLPDPKWVAALIRELLR